MEVSRGGYYVVENYVEMTLAQLQEIFADHDVNMRIIQSQQAISNVDRGTILSQSLQPGEKIDPQGDNEISIVLAASPSLPSHRRSWHGCGRSKGVAQWVWRRGRHTLDQ